MEYLDQMGRRIWLEQVPQRIISLVPSQTEFLCDLGLEEQLVGITKFCVHPKWIKKGKVIIGGTKNFNFDRIDALKPDLIIGNKEENYKEGIIRLSEKHPVWMSDINDLGAAFEMMRQLGKITDRQQHAEQIVSDIQLGLQDEFDHRGTAIYLIWQDPLIAVGKETFIDDLLRRAGYVNLISNDRYPEITAGEIASLKPDFLLLSSEPYPFSEKHRQAFQQTFSDLDVKLVDGEMFSWYGSRLLHTAHYFRNL